MDIGNRVKDLRKKKGLNQTELGEMLGLSFSGISAIESNRSNPSNEVLVKLSDVFGVSADYLLTGKERTGEISEDEREVLEIMRKDSEFSEAVRKAASFKKKAINYLVSYQQQHAHAA